MIHAAFIFATHLLLELADFREVGVEDAALTAEFTALDRVLLPEPLVPITPKATGSSFASQSWPKMSAAANCRPSAS